MGTLRRQTKWSRETFGPPKGASGVIDHLKKEIKEVEENPADLEEWIDIIILAIDGAWRSGHDASEIVGMLTTKFVKNKNRKWPPLDQQEEGKATEHIRD